MLVQSVQCIYGDTTEHSLSHRIQHHHCHSPLFYRCHKDKLGLCVNQLVCSFPLFPVKSQQSYYKIMASKLLIYVSNATLALKQHLTETIMLTLLGKAREIIFMRIICCKENRPFLSVLLSLFEREFFVVVITINTCDRPHLQISHNHYLTINVKEKKALKNLRRHLFHLGNKVKENLNSIIIQ